MKQTIMATSISMTGLQKNLMDSRGTLLDDFEVIGNWLVSGAGATIAADTTNYLTGSQSIKLTTGGSNFGYVRRVNMNWDLSGVDYLTFAFYLADATKSVTMSIELTNVANTYTNKFIKYIDVTTTGWNYVQLRKSEFSEVGSPVWTGINTIRFYLESVAGQTAIASFDSLYYNPSTKAAVLFTFDDWHTSVYDEAFASMRPHKIRGTFFVKGAELTGTLLSQSVTMNANGWDIANHTQDHIDLTTLDASNKETQLTNGKNTLEAAGFTRASRHVSYPGGAWNADVSIAMANTGMLTGRTILGSGTYPVMPIQLLYKFPIARSLGHTVSLATAKTDIDTAISQGGVCTFLTHTLVASPTTATQWGISDFQELIDYVVTKKSQITPITISDYYRLMSNPIKIPRVR